MESTVCHFEIPADDVDAAEKFYSALFGWTIAAAPQLGDQYRFIRTSAEPGALGGGILRRINGLHGLTLYFTVASVDESAKKVEALGGKVLLPKTAIPKIGWAVIAQDPQGNTIGCFQEDPEAA